jgi:hypothetical protein
MFHFSIFHQSVRIYLKILFVFFLITKIISAQWYWQYPLPAGNALWSVSFTDANFGTAVGDAGTILRTTDGGNTWINQSIKKISWLGRVSFTDANNGTITGYDVVAD